MSEMTRRDVVQGIMAMFGGAALLDVDAFLVRFSDAARGAAGAGVGPFTAEDVALLDEVSETILPATSTPGARAARTGAFMALMVTDSYSDPNQQIFRDGITSLQQKGFMKMNPTLRLTLLEAIDREQYDYTRQKKAEDPPHYFRLMKALAVQGYFTSEIGYTQALRYMETPGHYDPCVPYTAGEKIWASHA